MLLDRALVAPIACDFWFAHLVNTEVVLSSITIPAANRHKMQGLKKHHYVFKKLHYVFGKT